MRWRAALLLALLSCASKSERAPDEQAALGGSVAARVGGQAIPLSLVEQVARAQNISARDAARKVIDDEIAASAARARGLDTRQPAAWNLVATRGRLVADRIFAEAKAKGAPTDDEIRELSALHWAEVDRPPTVRVIHAIAIRPKKPEDRALAVEIAARLHDAVKGAESDVDFKAQAEAVPHPKSVDVRVEALPGFAPDGRVAEGGGAMDETFARAAHALAPGATSPVIETKFGWHVIRLLERLPESRMPFEERRVAFAAEVHAKRSSTATNDLLKGLLARHRVEVSPAAESLMRSVPISSEKQASNP